MFGGLGNDPFTEMDRMMNNMQRNMQQMQHQMMAAHSHAPAYAMQNQHYPQVSKHYSCNDRSFYNPLGDSN